MGGFPFQWQLQYHKRIWGIYVVQIFYSEVFIIIPFITGNQFEYQHNRYTKFNIK